MSKSYKYFRNFAFASVLLTLLLGFFVACDTPQKEPQATSAKKTHLVLAMPFRGSGYSLDPHWYTPEYANYLANLLPADKYTVTGYFVSFDNIPTFLDDMLNLSIFENVRVFNLCDGGEWDGYPCISLAEGWENHPVNDLIPVSGADSEFVINSDNKTTMQSHLAKANLKSISQVLVPSELLNEEELAALLATEGLDKAWPLFCKLNIGAGAYGIDNTSVCHNLNELVAQLQKMHTLFPTSDLLVQPYLSGKEYTVLILKDRVYAAVRVDYHNRYNVMEDAFLMDPKLIDDEIAFYPAPEHVKDVALKAIQAIPGKHHYSRLDLRDDAEGNTYVIDINDRPGIGNPSRVKYLLEYLNLTESQFLCDVIDTCSKGS